MNRVFRSDELWLLDVDHSAVFCRFLGHRTDQIRLPCEKRGDLQNRAHLGGGPGLRRLMNVGCDRQTESIPHAREDLKASFQAGSTKTVNACSVGLVEARLENECHIQLVSKSGQPLGNFQNQLFAFDDTGTGNDQQRLPLAASMTVDDDGISRHGESFRSE